MSVTLPRDDGTMTGVRPSEAKSEGVMTEAASGVQELHTDLANLFQSQERGCMQGWKVRSIRCYVFNLPAARSMHPIKEC
jgi:hypothetical protein